MYTKQSLQKLRDAAHTAVGSASDVYLHTRRLALALADLMIPHLPDEPPPLPDVTQEQDAGGSVPVGGYDPGHNARRIIPG